MKLKGKKPTKKIWIVQIAWLLLWLCILEKVCYSYYLSSHPSETVLACTMLMHSVAFPISFLSIYIYIFISKLLAFFGLPENYAVFPARGYIDLSILWISYFGASYIQWFVLPTFLYKIVMKKE